MSKETSSKKLLCPKAGTATSSPSFTTASQSFNGWWLGKMKKKEQTKN
jgi:hypothetical protein